MNWDNKTEALYYTENCICMYVFAPRFITYNAPLGLPPITAISWFQILLLMMYSTGSVKLYFSPGICMKICSLETNKQHLSQGNFPKSRSKSCEIRANTKLIWGLLCRAFLGQVLKTEQSSDKHMMSVLTMPCSHRAQLRHVSFPQYMIWARHCVVMILS